MAKVKIKYICDECGYESVKWLGKCPMCESFNTMTAEEAVSGSKQTYRAGGVETLDGITPSSEERIKTNIGELDRVLSGGIVEGSLILVGGDPGIGKSTLLIQVCQSVGCQGKRVLYISGEESTGQIKLRAARLDISTKNLLLLAETSMGIIESTIKQEKPDLVIIDSIQTVLMEELSSVPGSVSQIRECTGAFMRIAKGLNIPVFLVGHVTKEGEIAGPRVLEHMVDTVLYFEGEKRAGYRIIRSVKNRFGATNEIGVFEMRDKGLVEITNPSEYMLSGRPVDAPGSVVTCCIEGTRPILTEVQALVSYTNFGQPRRMATGVDYNRVVLLMAVLEKRAGLQLGNYDSYVNLAGGMKIAEPSLDASIVSAVASSYRNRAVDPFTLVFGEIGLTGEMRAVTMSEKRLSEAAKLGFLRCVMPRENAKDLRPLDGITICPVSNINELLEQIIR